MPFKITEYIPRRICTDDRLKKLRKLGFNTNGYERSLEAILKDQDFGLPSGNDEDGFGFMVNYKYIRIYLTYADALAEEILFLYKLNILKL